MQKHAKNEIKCLSQSAAERGRLSPEESNVVLENAVYLATRGVPLTSKAIVRRATAIVKARDGPTAPLIGHNWANRFLTQNLDTVSMYWGYQIDNKQGWAMNPTSNSEYWDTMGDLIVQKKIKYWRMFGMDKIGFIMGYAPRH
jgi:hypothetical protein